MLLSLHALTQLNSLIQDSRKLIIDFIFLSIIQLSNVYIKEDDLTIMSSSIDVAHNIY